MAYFSFRGEKSAFQIDVGSQVQEQVFLKAFAHEVILFYHRCVMSGKTSKTFNQFIQEVLDLNTLEGVTFSKVTCTMVEKLIIHVQIKNSLG